MDRKKITELYTNFEENSLVKIYDNKEFLYREYTVMQPLQRSYGITKERIENMLQKGVLSSIYDEGKVFEWENSLDPLDDKTKKKLQSFYDNKPLYDSVLQTLNDNVSDKVFYSLDEFEPYIKKVMADFDKKLITKITDGLSLMDKKAEIQTDKHGDILYDKDTKDTEIVKYEETIQDYMKREVLPHIPDAKAFFEGRSEIATFEEDRGQKNIKIGAEIPFTRYFYKYSEPEPSEKLAQDFQNLENQVRNKINELF